MTEPDLLRTQQIRSSFAHLPLTLSVSALNSTLLGAVLLDQTWRTAIIVWIGAQLGLSVLRLTFWYAHRRLDTSPKSTAWWGYVAAVGAFFSGLAWGYAPLLTEAGDPRLLFVAVVLCGMCAGAATVHAAHAATMLGFIVPAILPLIVVFFLRDQAAFGLLACVFGLSMVLASRKFRQWFREVTSAQLELAERTEELDSVNRRLRQEIADHRSTEEKLYQAQKLEALGQLTAGIAHDFNNLLMAIGGAAGQIAIRGEPANAPHVRTIMHSVERGATLTRQLLAFGRKQNLQPRSVDINAMLREWEKLLLATLGGYAQLVLHLSPLQMIAFVDAAQLENAVLNLVLNARDAMPLGGTITITTDRHYFTGQEDGTEGLVGDFVRLAVSDTGHGMSEDVRLKAFEPFFTTKQMQAGSGLGLSQVYGLVQQSGGMMRIDSEVGLGTTVVLYLPQGHGVATIQRSAEPKIPVGYHSGRLLLLDDDSEVREAVSAMLQTAGYTVVACDRAEKALDELRQRAADVLIVDFAMPDMRGDQFAEAARRLHPAVPILFITGYSEPNTLRQERWMLQKPFHAAQLVDVVEQAKADHDARDR
ncbi:MAG TPA: ATP-binding protein [Acetobacteraceae bacterium]|nr:ATP-binding protein [Acetobacteraceae bacterium]